VRRRIFGPVLFLPAVAAILFRAGAPASGPAAFRFAILGDRTGEAQPGVYEEAWREAAAAHPAFVITVGDTIEGLDDATAPAQWQQVEQMLKPYRSTPLYLVPGNHDIWSAVSETLFRRYAGHPPHYSFDYENVHFTVLDNSRTDEMPDSEVRFLAEDLRAHAAAPVKFVFSHRPSWLLNVMLDNPRFPLQDLARKYAVHHVVAGHVHQMLHADLDGVTYVSAPSAGGHLRNSRKYEDGWFFAYTLVEVHGAVVHFEIHELSPPYGRGRVTELKDWGKAGLEKAQAAYLTSICTSSSRVAPARFFGGVSSGMRAFFQ
jgi:predicted phosphodiesterase